MKHDARKMSVLAGVLAIGMICAGPRPAQAQLGGRESPVYCASDDKKEARCAMPWRDSVLLQQMSRAPCDEGVSWGIEPHGVWVRNGCRGTFISIERYRSDRAYGIPVPDDRQRRDDFRESDDSADPRKDSRYGRLIVRCESHDRARRYCGSNIRSWDVKIFRELSSTRCVHGYNWDVAGGRIWVDSGCKADFEVR